MELCEFCGKRMSSEETEKYQDKTICITCHQKLGNTSEKSYSKNIPGQVSSALLKVIGAIGLFIGVGLVLTNLTGNAVYRIVGMYNIIVSILIFGLSSVIDLLRLIVERIDKGRAR